MDLKRYKKTRYQNIYKSVKKQNYIIVIPGTHTTVGKDEKGDRIFDIEVAQKIRDNKKLRITKKIENINKGTFEELWQEYMKWCEDNLEYNTIKKKRIIYNAFLRDLDNYKVSKFKRCDFENLWRNMDTTDKEKNRILKETKAFFNWCIQKEYIIYNPLIGLKPYKIEKNEMKYWTPKEIKKFMDTVNYDIEYGDGETKKIAYLVKTFTLIGFSIGNRPGETRALRFCDVSQVGDDGLGQIRIEHSINYDTKSKIFLKTTKNEQSKRTVDASYKIINAINEYRNFLTNYLGLDIKDDTIIFINPITNKPYSDNALRKHFYQYVEKAGVKKIRLYDLRHTFVTTMMSEGWQLYHISKDVGHAKYNTTVDEYGHLTGKIEKEMAKSMEKYC